MAHAQDETLFSKIRLDLTGAWGGWQHQLTEIGDQNSLLGGGFGGLEFNKSVFVGWGAYHINERLSIDDVERDIQFKYNGPQLYYMPIAYRIVHPKLGVQMGFGKVKIDDGGTDRVTIVQPSVGGEINLFRWMRLGADVGYRFALGTELPGISDSFVSGLYGGLSLKFGYSWGRSYDD